MSYQFNAKHVGLEDDGFVLVLGFLDDEIKPEKQVLIQKTLEPDEQDKKLGMDKIHVQVETESRSGYGGIASIQYYDNELHIELTPNGEDFLRVDKKIVITLPRDKEIIAKVLNKLVIAANGEFLVEKGYESKRSVRTR